MSDHTIASNTRGYNLPNADSLKNSLSPRKDVYGTPLAFELSTSTEDIFPLCEVVPQNPIPIIPSLNEPATYPTNLQYLMDYFVNGMSKSISCHRGIQDALCSTIVPMAKSTPYLETAVLALAAAHRQSAGITDPIDLLEKLRNQTVTRLRTAISSDIQSADQLLATALVLCMGEIVAPGSNTTSWRMHLSGASALLYASDSNGLSQISSTTRFLRRKHRALLAVALACCFKHHEGPMLTLDSVAEEGELDDLAGYSTELLPIFQAINDLDAPKTDSEEPLTWRCYPDLPHFDCSSHTAHKSHILYDRVQLLLRKRSSSPRQLDGLPTQVHHDLCLLDESYHHMATLQIYRRGSLSVPFNIIEEAKTRILTCLNLLTYETKACPAVAALPPLFVAGTFACCVESRDLVRTLLRRLWMHYGMGNARASMLYLETFWTFENSSEDLAKSSTITKPSPDGPGNPLSRYDIADDILPY